MYTGLKSKAEQNPRYHNVHTMFRWGKVLTRCACLASTTTAPFGHCIGSHRTCEERGDFHLRAKAKSNTAGAPESGAII